MTDLVVPHGATWDDVRERLQHLLGTPDQAPRDDGAVVVATSGSSGTPKSVRIPGASLRASGLATAEVLGGHGRWILALPTHHVAGLQVLARSALAGTDPVVLDPGMPFTPARFAAAVSQLEEAEVADPQVTDAQVTTARPARVPLRITSLVPTQLRRLVDDPEGQDALSRMDVVLLGGSAADPALLDRARTTGCRVLHTYGMSETSGGCVYDGVPLPGVRVRVDPADDRVHLGGPVLADGYLDDPTLSTERFVSDAEGRWFLTDDRGVLEEVPDAEGRSRVRLRVLGRVDDVIVTGGHKVEPRDVEAAVRALPDVEDVLVVGLPDPEWGQIVGVVVVPAPPSSPASSSARSQASAPPSALPSALPSAPQSAPQSALADDPGAHRLRERLRPSLPPHALPRLVVAADAIPLLPSGKPDRAQAARLLDTGGRMESLST